MEGILDTASMDGYEYFVTAIMGMVGVRPAVAAIESGKKIALANKRRWSAGHIIMPLAAQKGVPILPVDEAQRHLPVPQRRPETGSRKSG